MIFGVVFFDMEKGELTAKRDEQTNDKNHEHETAVEHSLAFIQRQKISSDCAT